jgi:hypothetical protein
MGTWHDGTPKKKLWVSSITEKLEAIAEVRPLSAQEIELKSQSNE